MTISNVDLGEQGVYEGEIVFIEEFDWYPSTDDIFSMEILGKSSKQEPELEHKNDSIPALL